MASATRLWLLVAIVASAYSADVIRTQMDVMSKRFKLPNIENGWPLPDEEIKQETNVEGLLIQMPACLSLGGVCALNNECQPGYAHEAMDLCGDQRDAVCCQTRFPEDKHVIQLRSCAEVGGFCAWEEDCPRGERMVNELLCGEQFGVTCCKGGIIEKRGLGDSSRARPVQLESCVSLGGICRPKEQCLHRDRVEVDYDSCGAGGSMACCKASDEKLSKAHTVYLKSCTALGGICRPKNQCPLNDMVLVSYDSCGVQPNLACCKATDVGDSFNPLIQENEISDDKPKKRSKQLSKAHLVQMKSCMEAGGLCRPKKQCPEEDRMGNSDMCGNQPFITCCYSTNTTRPNGPQEFTDENAVTKKSKMHLAKRPEEFTDKNMYMKTPVLSCVMKGGLCVLAQDCEMEDTYEEAGLCGEAIEVSCCKKLPRKKAPCETRGGECVPVTTCGNGPKDVFGTCAGDDVCCVWTH